MSVRGALRRGKTVTSVAVLSVLVVAGCTNDQQSTESGESTSAPPASSPGGVPQVTPQPKKITRIAEDVVVRGKVEVVVDPLVDQPTRDLLERVLREAGAGEVVVREPGPPVEGASLRVRIGDRESPGIVKGMQHLRFEATRPSPPEGYALAASGEGDPTVLIGASDPAGAYYAVQTLRQLTSPGRIAGVGVSDEPLMPTRGTIEGFYGSPWTHEERMDQLAFYGDVKLNTYVYAPKDDPYHREQWRDPYPPDKLAEVQQLIGQAERNHVRFTFALSPGNSICYSEPAEWPALVAKLQTMYDSGVRDFSLPLDDISYTKWNCPQDQAAYGPASQGAAGRAQVDLLNRVQREFIDTHPGVNPLQTVSTEYSDLEDSPYKAAVREGLDPRVQVMWTGDGVIPEEILVEQAKQAAAVWGRKVMVWDNYPVNDFKGAQGRLLIGPYAKRESGMHSVVTGDVINPMNQAAASKVVELGAADFAWNDKAFDPQRAWRAAAEYLAGDRFTADRAGFAPDPATVDSLMVFFDLNHMSPLASGRPWQAPAPELARHLGDFRAAWDGGDRAAAVATLHTYAQAVADAPERIREGADQDFVSDSGPWLEATDLWGDAFLSTVDGLRARAEGDQARADERFAAAAELAGQAGRIQTTPGEPRTPGPVRLADGVLDVFIQQAPKM